MSVDAALRQAERMVAEGAAIIDVGGESTRPGSSSVPVDQELGRVLPIIDALSKEIDTPLSIDTSKAVVASQALDAGAEIINDISGLRFDAEMGRVAAHSRAGLVLMHSRGSFATMHSQPAVDDIVTEVVKGLHESVSAATLHGVSGQQIVVDPGIGFGKTSAQNLELLGKLDRIVLEFSGYPVLVGASRKSFIGKLSGDGAAGQRLGGSIAAALLAVERGAMIIRAHDVKDTVAAIATFAAAAAAE